ncbi:MAG TPA: hypothetical protein VK072_03870 [Candidatus Avamphibacillus sp.]|nr:hypothetical protein [Candidatus Avamphibacillus sp.]
MNYQPNVFKFLFSIKEHLFRIRKVEEMKPIWKSNVLLVVLSMLIYMWMAYLGIGSNLISKDAVNLGAQGYEASKFWFIVGRLLFGLLFALFVLFVPSYLFKLLTDIPYKKLVVMQQVVLLIMLIERLLWIPLMLFAGLDWYVSPLSLGIIASYLTEHAWIIYLFGAISIFQLWIIGFQVHFLKSLTTDMEKQWLWFSVIFLQVVGWGIATIFAVADQYIISGWFG